MSEIKCKYCGRIADLLHREVCHICNDIERLVLAYPRVSLKILLDNFEWKHIDGAEIKVTESERR